jgi:hypothetical protein
MRSRGRVAFRPMVFRSEGELTAAFCGGERS